ncbi:hypothetical protein [Candidatus Riesia pediculischaeffi]
MSDFPEENCCGAHVDRTIEIGLFF